MSEIITVGLDLAKNVFQVHGADISGRGVLRKKLRRDQAAVSAKPRASIRRSQDQHWKAAPNDEIPMPKSWNMTR